LDYQRYIGSDRWRKNPARVRELETACGKCRLCASGEPPLEVHHRSYENLGSEIDGDLVALCGRCHREVTSIIRRRKHFSRTPRRADVRCMRDVRSPFNIRNTKD
jgi:hypothetical protein